MHVVRPFARSLALLIASTLIVSACGGPKTIEFSPSPTSSAAQASATPKATLDPAAACEECWPLSGLAAANGAATTRRPLLIKIDNAPAARPHYAITQADMVFEIIVEGGVTRLAAVFQAPDPATTGGGRPAPLGRPPAPPVVPGPPLVPGTAPH